VGGDAETINVNFELFWRIQNFEMRMKESKEKSILRNFLILFILPIYHNIRATDLRLKVGRMLPIIFVSSACVFLSINSKCLL
jgi:hypothetical protein